MRNCYGMTLVELIVVLMIMSIAIIALHNTFVSQQQSYTRNVAITGIQETGQTIINMIKKDIIMAGYGVDKKLALYVEDGGATGPDNLYINDWGFIDEDELLKGIYGQADITNGNGTSTLTLNTLNIDSMGNDNCYSSNCNEFQGGVWQCIIVNGTDPDKKVARVLSTGANSLNLDSPVNANLSAPEVAPAIYYCVDDGSNSKCLVTGKNVLRRSDRSSGGRQPMANNVVDMQIAYRDKNGTWYCDGSGPCPMDPFDPQDISLIRINIVMRTAVRTTKGAGTGRPAVENRTAGPPDSFSYRVYTIQIVPRNLIY